MSDNDGTRRMANGWSPKDSAKLYNVKGWGQNYFAVGDNGHLAYQPKRSSRHSIDIKAVVDDVVARGVKLPVLVRFQDVLHDRVNLLNRTFRRAIEEHEYQGKYQGVYPIKVNQMREVVEEVLKAGRPYRLGLEAGSKPELMAVLALNDTDGLTIVNGYKDNEMMRLACLGLKLGRQVFVVIEKPGELDLLLKAAREMGVKPLIGLRVKLSAEGSGKWKTSGGHAAKFGLTTPEVVAAVRALKAEGAIESLKLLHFHIGSQITDIQAIQDAVKEATRVYAKLRKMDVPLEYLDCGGGLGVDYEGTKTSTDHSMNYTLDEYARGLVYSIQSVCQQEKVPEPNIVTESGRSVAAHHAMLVVNIFGSIEAGAAPIPVEESPKDHLVVREMRDALKSLTLETIGESYHDGLRWLEEANSLFRLGYIDLEDKAKAETLFARLCLEVRKLLPQAESVPDDVQSMASALHDQYLVNFSLFQSLPDSWAINHTFPIVPLHRLEEQPTREAALVDITCDSDGKVDQYVCVGRRRETLPVHELGAEPYYLGIFLMGAYQATMGDIHNLFGRVNEVHVFEDDDEPSGYYVEEVIRGQTVRDVLDDTQYSEYELVKMVRTALDAQVKAGTLKPREAVELLDSYEAVLRQYTYIDHGPREPEGAAAASESDTVPVT
ncbi:MAG: biosynthetic arginine decarboxylase [Elusimicrobia bacterium]|nr:biosynthetic arginine decarboxylase [Elusimicrobiota bacterium]